MPGSRDITLIVPGRETFVGIRRWANAGVVDAVPLLMFSVETPDDYGPSASPAGATDHACQSVTQARRGPYHIYWEIALDGVTDPEALDVSETYLKVGPLALR